MTQESIQEVLIERNIKRATLQESNSQEGNKEYVVKGKKNSRESRENKRFDVQEPIAVERKFDSD